MNKLLLISYYFPPCGGAAVMRWLRFIPLLMEEGWQVTVISPRDGDFPQYDFSLKDHLPSGIRLIQTKSFSFSRAWKKLSPSGETLPYGELKSFENANLMKRCLLWIRLNLIIPDLRVFWNPFAYQAAKKELRQNDYQLLISSGPPHSTHLLGLKLKQQFSLRWIADFRDPWTKIHYLQLSPPTPLVMNIHRYLERKIVKTADKCLVVSENIKAELPAGNKVVLYNGFDARDFENIPYHRDEIFRIKYIGQITAGQDILALMRILLPLMAGKKYSLSFIGTNLEENTIKELLTLAPGKVIVKPFVEHAEAISEMVNSELLILLINQNKHNLGIITTKLFEYIGSKTKILCVGPAQGEAAQIIHRYDAGFCFDYTLPKDKFSALQILYELWNENGLLKNTCDVSELSVQQQVHQLIREMV